MHPASRASEKNRESLTSPEAPSVIACAYSSQARRKNGALGEAPPPLDRASASRFVMRLVRSASTACWNIALTSVDIERWKAGDDWPTATETTRCSWMISL